MGNTFSNLCVTKRATDILRLLILSIFAFYVFFDSPVYTQTERNRNSTAQTRRARLPSPERIVRDYLQAIGGKRRVSSIRSAVHEWEARRNAETVSGTAQTQIRTPASVRIDLTLIGQGERSAGANARTAWTHDTAAGGQTLTDGESAVARLGAALYASRFVDFRRQNILARTVALEQVNNEPAYMVGFSTREGARVRGWFAQASKLLLQMSDENGGRTIRFSDYRVYSSTLGILEPHRVTLPINTGGDNSLTLSLRSVNYNPSLAANLFDPPAAETIDVAALLREVERNQNQIDERRRDYTFLQRETERQINDRGQVTEERIRVYEVYPVPGRRPVFKLISENGVPLTGERAEREARRAANELEEAERDRERNLHRAERERMRRAGRAQNDNRSTSEGNSRDNNQQNEPEDPRSFTAILFRACELVSPRRERFRDRDAIVFDFRPRSGFRPRTREESIVSKLSGIMWIDAAEKQVMRFEARLVETFSIGGGLLVSMRPGSLLIVEQTRLPDGVWLPRSAQFVASIRLLLFGGGQYNVTQEWSDYRRFNVQTTDEIINSPSTIP
jgi:hypothetical protein